MADEDPHWFDKYCDTRLPMWEERVEEAMEKIAARERRKRLKELAKQPARNGVLLDVLLPETDAEVLRSRRANVEAELAKTARDDLLRHESELTQKIAQTAAILTAATLFIAVYALKPSLQALGMYLSVALCFAAVAFMTSLIPLAPPIKRALFKRYVPSHEWTLLTYDAFTNWVMDSWLCDRRKDVLTKYKVAHAIAVPILSIAAIVIMAGAMTNLF